MMMIFSMSCHESGPDPTDNPVDPGDTFLINAYAKWGGDYIGDRINENIYKQDTTWDTINNVLLKLKRIVRDTNYTDVIDVIFEQYNDEWFPVYAQEEWFDQDTMHLTWALGSGWLDVIMDGVNKTITTRSAYTPPSPYPVADYSWGFYRKVE